MADKKNNPLVLQPQVDIKPPEGLGGIDSPADLKKEIESKVSTLGELGKVKYNRAQRRRRIKQPNANSHTKKQLTRSEIKKRRKKGRK